MKARARGTRRRWSVVAVVLLGFPVSAAAQQDSIQAVDEGVRFEFQDVDLSLVLNALAEAGGLNLVYGSLPDQTVTLRLSDPVPPQEIPGLLESIARANGLEPVEEGAVLRLVPVSTDADVPDSAAAPPARRLYVHRLQHARAARLAGTLQAIFGGTAPAAGVAPELSSRPLSERLRSQGVRPLLPTPESEQEPDPSADAVPADSFSADLSAEIQIVPDETTNALIVRATPEDWQILSEAIQALDLRPLQVLIEVVIAEVNRTTDFDVGVEAEAVVEGGVGEVEGQLGAAGVQTRSAGDLVLEVMRSAGSPDVRGFLSLLATEGSVRILSRPVLLAQNNQEARILIGDERPFIQVFRSLPTDAAVRDQVVQYRDVGTALTILPTINTDGYVNLILTQEVSTATAETQFGAPVISAREATTHLLVRDSQTVVIGGLTDREETESESGVPLLKDVPLLGNLFKSRSRGLRRSELFIFVTPRIVATDEDAERIRRRLEDDTELLRPDTLPMRRFVDPLSPVGDSETEP